MRSTLFFILGIIFSVNIYAQNNGQPGQLSGSTYSQLFPFLPFNRETTEEPPSEEPSSTSSVAERIAFVVNEDPLEVIGYPSPRGLYPHNEEVWQAFLERIATDDTLDLSARGQRGYTLFEHAILSARSDLIEILIDKGVNVTYEHLALNAPRLNSLRIQFCAVAGIINVNFAQVRDFLQVNDPRCTDEVVRSFNLPRTFWYRPFAEDVRQSYLRHRQTRVVLISAF